MKTHAHVHRLAATLITLYAGAVVTYVHAEHHSVGDAAWWAFMTFTTVGYGDQYPHSVPGRVAGILLVSTAVFLVVPVITASIIERFRDKTDAWTHDEQEEVKENLRRVVAILERKN